MRRFQSDFLQQLKDRVDIADIIGSYVTLKKKGSRYWGCCPFHQEKTPSFSVSSEKGLYYCFGCHASGDVISFLMKIEGLTFAETVEKLAEQVHMELPPEEINAEEARRREELQVMYDTVDLAAAYFHNCLTKTHMGQAGREYFAQRGLSAETIEHFRLGYAPPDGDRLYRDFTKRHIAGNILKTIGLAGERGNRFYDMFRGRCMFSIQDLRGRTVAFGGRVLDGSKPKYLNSPETPIFNKRRLLFALYQALPEIRKRRQVIMVEGYMDAITLHAAGVTHAVASLGTAFTEEQARLLKRYADEIVFSYDMDTAGQNATRRALEIAGKTGLKIRVATVPEGKDPDEFVRLYGGEAFLEAVKGAAPALDYLLASFIRQYDDMSLEGKQQILKNLLPVLVTQDDPLVVDSYIRKTAGRLRLDEGIVRSEAIRYAGQRHEPVYIARRSAGGTLHGGPQDQELRRRRSLEEGFIRFCIEKRRFPAGWEPLRSYSFSDDFNQHIFTVLVNLEEAGIPLDQTAVENAAGEENRERLAALLMKADEGPAVSPWESYIKPLKMGMLKKEYREHSERANELMQQSDKEGYEKEMLFCIHLNKEIRDLLKGMPAEKNKSL